MDLCDLCPQTRRLHYCYVWPCRSMHTEQSRYRLHFLKSTQSFEERKHILAGECERDVEIGSRREKLHEALEQRRVHRELWSDKTRISVETDLTRTAHYVRRNQRAVRHFDSPSKTLAWHGTVAQTARLAA